MAATETSPLADAFHAWDCADFPLLPTDYADQHVVITSREHFGREGYLPTEVFRPTTFVLDIEHPERTMHELRESRVGTHWDAVLESNLGTHGHRFDGMVATELMYLSILQHRATVAISASRILVAKDAPHQTMFSVWDNGKQYDSPEAIQRRFAHDSSGDLAERPSVASPVNRDGLAEVYTRGIVQNTCAVFGGTLTVLSGVHRVDIREVGDGGSNAVYDFVYSETAGVAGNLVVARAPHVQHG